MNLLAWWSASTIVSPVSIAAVLTIAALAATAVIKTKWARRSFRAHGDLLLQMEIYGHLVAHIALLAAENRNGKPRYCWALAEAEPALPHMQMVDLPFTHITVAQRQGEIDVLAISVVQRRAGLRHADYYWIKNAAIGRKPGFPQAILLPNNLVLRFTDELLDYQPL